MNFSPTSFKGMPSYPRRLAVLGSTGSIGKNTLEVVRKNPDCFSVICLSCRSQFELLDRQAGEFGCPYVSAPDTDALRRGISGKSTVINDDDELCSLVSDRNRIDMLVCAVQGTASIKPVLAALKAGIPVALASKEILVSAGALVTRIARENNAPLLPIDSEHCAIFQCLEGQEKSQVRRLLLTCSGGPFFKHPDVDFHTVTLEQALAHPTWNMGRKITIDSATLMNKALEIIEAGWLFGFNADQIDVVIHPQSIVHSMIECIDGSVLAQLGPADMKIPIQFCLTYPERRPCPGSFLDFSRILQCEFLPPDTKRFPALELAKRVLRTGGTAGTIFNAANEAAVQRFIAGTLPFDRIPALAEEALDKIPVCQPQSLDDILAVHQQTFEFALNAAS